MTPVLVATPASVPVDLDALKLHLRVTHAYEDALIAALGAAAVGYLDGWRGVLGRAIIAQTWSVEAPCAGDFTLPMPDVSAVTVDYGDGAVALTPVIGDGGPVVTVTGEGTVTFTCAMPQAQLDVVIVVIKMLVGHWYENREAVNIGNITSDLPFGVDQLIGVLRWRRV